MFMGPILDYARVSTDFGGIVIIMMIGQMAFSMAALYAVVLSMCHQEKFLLWMQLGMTMLFVPLLVAVCATGTLVAASWVFVVAYSALACALFFNVRRLTDAGVRHS